MAWKYRLGQKVEVRHRGEWISGVIEAHRNDHYAFYQVRLSREWKGDGYVMNWIGARARDIREPKGTQTKGTK